MKCHTWAGIGLLTLVTTAIAQTIGDVTPVDLPGGMATLTLDFTERDYELILYSTVTDEPDSSRTFNYTVSSPSTSPLVHRNPEPASSTQRDRLEALLRQQERALAARLREAGGWRPPLRKAVQPLQGSTRTFTFPAFGGVTTDQTVEATLVASNARSLGYLDNVLTAGGENITPTDIQAMLARFDAITYPFVTGTFGAASDVDGDGRVLFLYTPLVDRVGSVAGFYFSRSLFSADRGGDGNIADMMFISPTRPQISYESLLAHEFQHLISFNQHALVRNGKGEESWLNEALSHVTEDLVNGHIDGGNPDLIGIFMETPEAYALTGNALLNAGIRGAAYLFLRSLIEDFGEGIPGQLVQTERTGIPNVEAITGRSFQDLYRTFAARLFLSGNGLSEVSDHNYTYTYFTEPETKHRSLPPPRQQRLSTGQSPVSGVVKPATLAFIRLTGSGPAQPVEIQTEAGGAFRALTIPLPKNFLPRLTLPVDFFSGIKFDVPLPGTYTAGESVLFSGTVQDASITLLLLTFKPRTGQGDEISYRFDVTNGQFSQSIVFAPSHAGEYTLHLFAGQKKEDSLPSVGRFPGVFVTAGTGTVNLPVDFFSGITLDAPLPGIYPAEEGLRISGTTSDPSVSRIKVLFAPHSETGESIDFFFDVTDEKFGRGIVFHPSQAGDYTLSLFAGQKGAESLPLAGSFSPVTVTEGTGTVNLPVDFFAGITLDAPLPGIYPTGEGLRISGTTSDPSVSRILFSFDPLGGTGDTVQFFTDPENEKFSLSILFHPSQVGDYNLKIFTGQRGGSLLPVDSFSPVTVTEGTGTVNLPVDFFSGITLDAPLPTQYQAGSGTSLSGRTTDSAIEVLLLVFTSETGSEIRVQTDVSNSTFRKGFVFTPQQAGTYSLNVFGGPRGGSLLHRGTFSPVTVTATGAERVYLPVDLFDNLLLDRPLTAGFFAGKQETFSGQATDSGITRIAISFIPASGGPSIDTFTDVENARFSANLTFESSQTGTYTVRIFGGQTGQSLPFLGEFSPVEIFPSRPDLLLRQTALTWGELEVGQTRSLPLTLVNSGSDPLVISGISSNSDPFSAAPTTLTISPGDSATVTLTFAPTAGGTASGALQILSNDPDRGTVQIALAGSATVPRLPGLLLRQTTLTFEGVEVGQTRDLPLTLVNSGASDLIVSRISSEGDLFSVAGESFTISPGDSATVTLTFAPITKGAASGTLQILSNDPDRGTVQIALSGTAVAPAPAAPSADFNGDGQVNFPDFLAFASAFGARQDDANYSATFDLDVSGDVGFPDFLIFAAAFGQPTGG